MQTHPHNLIEERGSYLLRVKQKMVSLKDEEADTLVRETVAMGAGSVEDNGYRIEAISSAIDDANRNPMQNKGEVLHVVHV